MQASPVIDSRTNVFGIPVQKICGTGKPPWNCVMMEEVNRSIDALKNIKLEIVALSPHDSCDASIGAFKKAFSSAYRDTRLGKSIIIGRPQ